MVPQPQTGDTSIFYHSRTFIGRSKGQVSLWPTDWRYKLSFLQIHAHSSTSTLSDFHFFQGQLTLEQPGDWGALTTPAEIPQVTSDSPNTALSLVPIRPWFQEPWQTLQSVGARARSAKWPDQCPHCRICDSKCGSETEELFIEKTHTNVDPRTLHPCCSRVN